MKTLECFSDLSEAVVPMIDPTCTCKDRQAVLPRPRNTCYSGFLCVVDNGPVQYEQFSKELVADAQRKGSPQTLTFIAQYGCSWSFTLIQA
jgi:hypothetical protein